MALVPGGGSPQGDMGPWRPRDTGQPWVFPHVLHVCTGPTPLCSVAPATETTLFLRACPGQPQPPSPSRHCRTPPNQSHVHRTRTPTSIAYAQDQTPPILRMCAGGPPPSPSRPRRTPPNQSNVYRTRAPPFQSRLHRTPPPSLLRTHRTPPFPSGLRWTGGAVKYPLYHSRKGELSGTVVCACEGLGGG